MWSWYRGIKVEATATVLLYHLEPVVQGQSVSKEWLELNLRFLAQSFDYAFDKIYIVCTDKTQQQFAEDYALYHTRVFSDGRFPGNNKIFKGDIKVLLADSLAKVFKLPETCDPQYVYLYWSTRVAYFNTKHDNPMEFFKGMIKADPARLIVPSQYGTGLTDRLMLNEPGLIKDVDTFEAIRARGKVDSQDHYLIHRELFQRLLTNPKEELPERTIKSETFRHQLCPGVMIYAGDLISKVLVETDDDQSFYQKLGNMNLTMTLCSMAGRVFVDDPFVLNGYYWLIKPITRNNAMSYLRMLNTTFTVSPPKEEVLAGSMLLQVGKIESTVNQSETRKVVEGVNKYYGNLSETSVINWMGFDSDVTMTKLTESKIDSRVRLVQGLSEAHIQTIFSCFKVAKFDGLILNDATLEQLDQLIKLGLVKVGVRVILVSTQSLLGKTTAADLDLVRMLYKYSCESGLAVQPVQVSDSKMILALVNYKENGGSSGSY